MVVKVALAGATGNLGPSILKALVEAGFGVTVLTRKDGSSASKIPNHSNQRIIGIDYQDAQSLRSALKGVDVVVSNLPAAIPDTQKLLIDAAVAAGIKRFIPSEFGSDMENPLNQKLPFFKGKVQIREYLEELTKSHPDFSYTLTYNNLFLDWGLRVGFVMNVKEHSATVYDGGDVPISMTRTSTVGRAVVAIINNLNATKNKGVYYHDGAWTQNQLIDMIKSIDGKEWSTKQVSTAEIEKASWDAYNKGDTSVKTLVGFLIRAAFSTEHTPDFTGRTDNELLGLGEMSNAEVVELLKTFL